MRYAGHCFLKDVDKHLQKRVCQLTCNSMMRHVMIYKNRTYYHITDQVHATLLIFYVCFQTSLQGKITPNDGQHFKALTKRYSFTCKLGSEQIMPN